MKRHTMQTVQRADGSTYQTLNTRRMRNASPLQTVLPAQRRLSIVSLVLIALIVALIALAVTLSLSKGSSAHAQSIGEPWCQIGSAPAPAITCVQPRIYLPEVTR